MTALKNRSLWQSLALVTAFIAVKTVHGAVTLEERATISIEGTELTAAGATRAGNAEGTIPAWKNEKIALPEEHKTGEFLPDPFVDDAVKFTITAQNFREHNEKLSKGQIAMFKTYPEYFMNIYPTRRSVVYKTYIYEAALKNLDRSKFKHVDKNMGMIGFTGARKAWAFPIPHSAEEAFLNQESRPRNPWSESRVVTLATTANGHYVENKGRVYSHNKWSDPEISDDSPEADPEENIALGNAVAISPPKVAGRSGLVWEPVSYVKNFRKAWLYDAGQRRVKRAPQLIYNNPVAASDGLATTDQLGGFNGPNDRFSYKLLGKREVYVPYNPYKQANREATLDKVIRSDGRFNQDFARYELHRVWVIEATLKEGTNHDYGRRVFYLDEDSWEVLLVDVYDRRLEFWRYWESHLLYYYDIQFPIVVAQLQYDLNANRMFALVIDKDSPPDFTWREPDRFFTPGALRRRGTR
jgi:hypothetical protein